MRLPRRAKFLFVVNLARLVSRTALVPLHVSIVPRASLTHPSPPRQPRLVTVASWVIRIVDLNGVVILLCIVVVSVALLLLGQFRPRGARGCWWPTRAGRAIGARGYGAGQARRRRWPSDELETIAVHSLIRSSTVGLRPRRLAGCRYAVCGRRICSPASCRRWCASAQHGARAARANWPRVGRWAPGPRRVRPARAAAAARLSRPAPDAGCRAAETWVEAAASTLPVPWAARRGPGQGTAAAAASSAYCCPMAASSSTALGAAAATAASTRVPAAAAAAARGRAIARWRRLRAAEFQHDAPELLHLRGQRAAAADIAPPPAAASRHGRRRGPRRLLGGVMAREQAARCLES